MPNSDKGLTPILATKGVRKYFPVRRGVLQRVTGWIKAVDGVDLEVYPGRTLGLVGESGCGKSTVARLILRLIEPDTGKIFFQGEDLTNLSEQQMKPWRRKMQIIFQDPYGSLNPRMTVGESIAEGLRAIGIKGKAEQKERIAQLLQMVQMNPEAADLYPHQFSGGQRQRIGIARALSVGPSLIICDEPVSALDVSIQSQIINLLKELQESLGVSYLFISHDLNVVGYLADTVAVMYLGLIMEYAPADILYEQPLHPYTRALLAAIPKPDPSQRGPLPTLSGEVPTPLDPPPGCRFQGRCPLVEERCRTEEIPLFELDNSHAVRCWKVIRG